jgi:hypothetical protein
MIALPSLLLVAGAVLLGIYLGIFYLRGVRPKRLPVQARFEGRRLASREFLFREQQISMASG